MVLFEIGQLVHWRTDLKQIFAAFAADCKQRYGTGPFKVLRVRPAEDPALAGHQQEVTIVTPLGEAHLSGMWFKSAGPNTPAA
ncbi:MAG: hypothetical protein HY421_01925 [Candidatus Kerfeldbacteria bacterium]|nr:hypothetical protein [Candidatus Kerfeldbacteria bacterium]